jgi:methionyl-tRNA formyltransferase
MILQEIAFVAAPTLRSRAYAQAMEAAGLLPRAVLYLPGAEPQWEGDEAIGIEGVPGFPAPAFRPGEPVRTTLSAVPCQIELPASDINAPQVIRELGSLRETGVIYSGLPGVILRRAVLECGKRFLHVHGGFAPRYRGSTAFYYSLLAEGTLGVTALWLNESLDGGEIVARRSFEPPAIADIDRVVDPVARAGLLADVLRVCAASGRFTEPIRDDDPGQVYYVIHPVLKHLARRRVAAASAAASIGRRS